jgi:hypothetical protein
MTAVRARALAVASDPVAAAAANEMLARGNAVDAVVAGVLAAAGEHAGVLLGPVQLLIGGPGVGLRAIDGRVRQPGKGVARPRGFLPDEAIPRAARVGVPGLPAALALALASFGKTTAAQVAAAGIARAAAVPERKAVLVRLAQRGPSALADEQIAGELVAATGRNAGGVLTEQDLQDIRPSLEGCATFEMDGRRVATVPWGATSIRDARQAGPSGLDVHAVVAADVRGVLAIACYLAPGPDDAASIEALGLSAPLLAAPVLRGTPRVKPGDLIVAAAPMALSSVLDADAVDVALAAVRAADAERSLGTLLRALAGGAPLDAAARSSDARALGVVRGATDVTAVGD